MGSFGTTIRRKEWTDEEKSWRHFPVVLGRSFVLGGGRPAFAGVRYSRWGYFVRPETPETPPDCLRFVALGAKYPRRACTSRPCWSTFTSKR
jgi:hypothetical protein